VVIVAGRFTLDPADREAFLASRDAGMRRSRAEPGCITYVFSADPLEPGVVHLDERWETKDALLTHVAGQQGQPPAEPAVPVLESEIVQYEISRSGPIGS
jgi:quinol monooxygenase YgiN